MADVVYRFLPPIATANSTSNHNKNPVLLFRSPSIRLPSPPLLNLSGNPGFNPSANRSSNFKVHATVAEESDGPKWWVRNAGPNMIDIHSTEELLDALRQAGDKLVIVEFYATWCGSCRALFPKICKIAQQHPEIMFLKVDFDENKPICKRLNVRVLPYFQFYRGADGLLESFSCSLAKLQKIKDAISAHNTPHCSITPLGADQNLNEKSNPQDKPAEASSR